MNNTDKLLALLPDDATLDAVDDDQFSGRRSCPIVFTIAQARELRRALAQPAEAVEDSIVEAAYKAGASSMADRLAPTHDAAQGAVAWQINATKSDRGWEPCTRECYEDTLRTGRYMGLPTGTKDVEIRALIVAGTHPQAAPAQGDDTRRMDWLEGQREAYGFENEHLGNRWTIDGPFRSARDAIDAAMSAAPSPEPRS